MAYIKIDFDLYDINDEKIEVNFNKVCNEYCHMEYDLNKCLLDYIIDKQHFCTHHVILNMDLNNVLDKNKNICTLEPIHISINKNWYGENNTDIDASKVATFTLWIKTKSYCVYVEDFKELKDYIIGNRLYYLFNEIYGQLVDGWGENLNFNVLNYETLETEVMFPEFKRKTMRLVARMGD